MCVKKRIRSDRKSPVQLAGAKGSLFVCMCKSSENSVFSVEFVTKQATMYTYIKS